MTMTIGGMLLASTDPTRLHDWYAGALSPDHDEKVDQYRVLDFGGFYLLVDTRDDVSGTNPEPGRMILNFEVTDIHAVIARLDADGTQWLAPLEDRDGSLFATAIDPDGNYVQFIQLSHQERVNMARSVVGDKATALSAAKAFSGFAVDDMDAARRFYGQTLGLLVEDGEMGMLTLRIVGREPVLVYPKPDHEPASYTILNFPVPDVAAAVDELSARGVVFERYPEFEQDDRGIMRDAEGPAIAWFKDPAGNILAVMEE